MLLNLGRQGLGLPGRQDLIPFQDDVSVSGLVFVVDLGRPGAVVGLGEVSVRRPVGKAVKARPGPVLLLPPGQGSVLL